MSGSIFDNDDDFVLADGSDIGSAKSPAAPRPETPVRPVQNEVQSRRNLRSPGTRPSLPPAPDMNRRLPTSRPVAPTHQTPEPRQAEPEYRAPAPAPQQYTPPVPQPQPEQYFPPVQQPARQELEPRLVEQPRYVEPSNAVAPVNFPVRENIRDIDPAPRNQSPYQELEQRSTPTYAEPERNRSSLYDEEELAPKKGSRASKRTANNSKGKKAPREKKPSNFAGNRKWILVVRIIAATLALILLAAGAKSIFFPPTFPGQATVLGAVKKNLGITAFPTAAGEGFVSSFSREYLTITPKESSKKTEALKQYTIDVLATSIVSSSDDTLAQNVTQGPIISGVESVDDNNAIYTVAAQLNGTRWVYFNVPVYFDKTANGFLVSGTPAFIAPPVKAADPKKPNDYENDTKLANDVTSNIQGFFQAWATSNKEGLGRYMTNDAPETAKIGLSNTFTFVSVSDIRVESKGSEDPKPNNRKAQATVVWADPTNPKITYRQTYNLELFKQPDERWYIANIEGGAAKTSG